MSGRSTMRTSGGLGPEIARALADAVDEAASAVFGGEWSTDLARVTALNPSAVPTHRAPGTGDSMSGRSTMRTSGGLGLEGKIARALADAVDEAASAVFGGEWSTDLARVTALNRWPSAVPTHRAPGTGDSMSGRSTMRTSGGLGLEGA
jgi:hypothetical protein